MKLILVLASLIAVSSAYGVNLKSGIEFDTCFDGTENYITNLHASVTPDPIKLESGAQVAIVVYSELLKEIATGTQVSVGVVKKGAVPLPIPCIEVRNL